MYVCMRTYVLHMFCGVDLVNIHTGTYIFVFSYLWYSHFVTYVCAGRL